MSLFTMRFFVFLFIAVAGYYLCPKKLQWCWLLCVSYFFYLTGGFGTAAYILFTTVTVWAGALWIAGTQKLCREKLAGEQDKEHKKAVKKQARQKEQKIFWAVLAVNLGILAYLKYADFVRFNFGRLLQAFGGQEKEFVSLGLLLPLGISFYTFQSLSYLIDVYRGKYAPESNLFRFALYVSYFPQIIQGPINRYDLMAGDLYASRKFDWDALERGALRMLWGYFKKLVIADRIGMVVNAVFDHYGDYSGGVIAVAVLGFAIQQYADFSGGIDVVMGISETLGIRMSENFKNPYFSRSLSEFWRRWHISLGAWMRDYVFYPLSLTKGMAKVSKWTKNHLGKAVGRVAPVCIANIVVFLLVGIWHGANWHYIMWGLYNGLIIACSALLEPLFAKALKLFSIRTESRLWRLFQIFRTFLIVNIGGYFDRGNSLPDAFAMMKRTITDFQITDISPAFLVNLGGMNALHWAVFIAAILLLLTVSILQEKGVSVRTALLQKNLLIRWGCYLLLFYAVIALQLSGTDWLGGFMYAHF